MIITGLQRGKTKAKKYNRVDVQSRKNEDGYILALIFMVAHAGDINYTRVVDQIGFHLHLARSEDM